MDTKKVGQTAFLVVGLLVAIVVAFSILLNPTGGISGLSKLVTFAGIIIGILNPKAGLYFLAAQVMYSDEIKRFAVYYGVTSQLTISEVLIGPLLSLCAINASFLYGVLRDRYTLGRLGWVLYALVPVAAVGSYSGNATGATGALLLYGIATFALYISLVPVCYGLFRTFKEWVDFISWQALLAAPCGAWAIWQYYNGFNQLEWTYAMSGLSLTHTTQMLSEDPRVFGLFGTAGALGSVATYGVFCVWRAIRFNTKRIGFLLLALVFFYAVVVSQQRGTLLFPFIAFAAAMVYRRPSTTILFYVSAIGIFVLGVLNATFLLEVGIERINSVIAMEGRWGSMLNVNTMADRIIGWERLGRASSWSLFGTGNQLASSMAAQDFNDGEYNHDAINKILMQFGAVGLVSGIIFAAIFLYTLHRMTFRSRDVQVRRDGAFVMGCIIPALLISVMAGDNLNAPVVSLQIWTIFSGIFVIGRLTGAKDFLGQSEIAQAPAPIAPPGSLPQHAR